MRHALLRAAAAAVVCLSLASSPLFLSAQASPDPTTEFVPAVWVAESEGLLKLRADTGAALVELGAAGGVRAVAVDDRRNLVWAYTPGTLQGYTLGGVLTRSVPVPTPAGYTDATPVALAVNLASGAVWLSVGPTLRQVGETGAPLTTQSLLEAPKVLAYDLLTARLWVGTAHHVVALDDAGGQVAALALTNDTVHDLAVDPTSGDLWVALNNTLRRYNGTTLAVEADTRIPALKWVTADGQGGAWQTTPQNLFRLSAAGQTLVSLDPWPGPGPLVAVAGDPRDGSAWVASHTGVSHVARDGALGPVVPLSSATTVRRLALYADRYAPTVAIAALPAFTNDSSPTIEVTYGDIGSGIDPASLGLTENGTSIAVTCEPAEGGATCVSRPRSPTARSRSWPPSRTGRGTSPSPPPSRSRSTRPRRRSS